MSIQALVEQFQNKTLAKEAWTHEAHLTVGLVYAVDAPETALAKLRTQIRAYNAALGGRNTETEGYHETITAFYAYLLRHFAETHELQQVDEAALTLLLGSPYADRQFPLHYYSKDRLFSPEARLGFIPPDLQPFPLITASVL